MGKTFRKSDMVQWLTGALDYAGISQSELARRVSESLGESLDRSMINKVLTGKRELSAREMLAVASVTEYPVPPIESDLAEALDLLGKVPEARQGVLALLRIGPGETPKP